MSTSSDNLINLIKIESPDPFQDGVISCLSSSDYYSTIEKSCSQIFNHSMGWAPVANDNNNYNMISFLNHYLYVYSFSLLGIGQPPMSFKLEGSVNGFDWNVLYEQSNNNNLCGLGDKKIFTVSSPMIVRFLRVRTTGARCDDKYINAAFTGLELYGRLLPLRITKKHKKASITVILLINIIM